MKQHITVEDLLSLTPAQQERLREWYLSRRQFGDWVAFRQDGTWVADILVEHNDTHCWASGWYADHTQTPADEILPLLSVGQCMELLAAKIVAIGQTVFNGKSVQEWVITTAFNRYAALELVDALFAAVREVM